MPCISTWTQHTFQNSRSVLLQKPAHRRPWALRRSSWRRTCVRLVSAVCDFPSDLLARTQSGGRRIRHLKVIVSNKGRSSTHKKKNVPTRSRILARVRDSPELAPLRRSCWELSTLLSLSHGDARHTLPPGGEVEGVGPVGLDGKGDKAMFKPHG